MKKYRLGDMRYLITFRQKTAGDDWSVSETWSDVAGAVDVFCGIAPKQATETADVNQMRDRQTIDIYVRYRSDITTDMRADFNGQLWEVFGIVNVDQRNRFLRITLVDSGEST